MTLFDVNEAITQVAAMVKACIEAGRDQVSMSIAEIRIKAPELGDVSGLREQIVGKLHRTHGRASWLCSCSS